MPGMPQLECRKLWLKSQATAQIGCRLVAFHSRKWNGLRLRLPHALPTFCRSTACVSQALCRPHLRPCDSRVPDLEGLPCAWVSGGTTRSVEQETKAVSATPPSLAIEALVLGVNARCVEQQQQLQKRRRLEARSCLDIGVSEGDLASLALSTDGIFVHRSPRNANAPCREQLGSCISSS